MDRGSATQIWQAVLGELQLQVTGPIFATYLRDTAGARFDGRTFTVAAPSDFVVEHLAHKLRPLLAHTISSVTGGPVELSFEVAGAAPRAPAAPPRSPSGGGADQGLRAVPSPVASLVPPEPPPPASP